MKHLGRWAIYFTIKVVITLVAILSIQHVIHSQGYLLDLKTLGTVAIILIVLVKTWTFNYKHDLIP